MKKIVIGLLLIVLLAPGSFAAEKGQQSEEGNWIEADSSFYFLDRAQEKVNLFFADEEEKAKLKMKYGYERLTEARKMLEQDKPEEAKQLMKEGMNNLGQATKMATKNLMSQEEWQQLKNNFSKSLTKLQAEITSSEFTQQVKDFFNPQSENK